MKYNWIDKGFRRYLNHSNIDKSVPRSRTRVSFARKSKNKMNKKNTKKQKRTLMELFSSFQGELHDAWYRSLRNIATLRSWVRVIFVFI